MDGMPTWTLDQIAGLVFGVRVLEMGREGAACCLDSMMAPRTTAAEGQGGRSCLVFAHIGC
jgi:hypothetical protein